MSPPLVLAVATPLAIVLATMLALSAILYFFAAGGEAKLPEAKNPAALTPAMIFAAIYTVITLASAYAQAELGTGALYVVALVAGLTDVDAITLSTAGLAARGSLAAATAWRVILVAALANLAFKLGIVCVLSPRLAPRIALTFGITGTVGVALIALWPDA